MVICFLVVALQRRSLVQGAGLRAKCWIGAGQSRGKPRSYHEGTGYIRWSAVETASRLLHAAPYGGFEGSRYSIEIGMVEHEGGLDDPQWHQLMVTERPLGLWVRVNRPFCSGTSATIFGLLMVMHFAYREEHFATVDDLDRGVQTLIDLGWRIAQVRGPDHGPFAVLFRMDDATRAVTAEAM